ncbi:adenylate/guanylate cyclase domain-containing protein [Legionella sp. D16C41]|uniref:adenylate/guanylate cyclase domain-containing protein n=1 Tax=Legionella sp. D16C41 TaxID=3402688 RepID=UPI003AF874FA
MQLINNLISYLLTLVKIIIWVFIFITLFGLAKPYVADLNRYPYLDSVMKVEKTLNTNVKNYIPTTIASRDLSRPITIVFLIILSGITSRLRETLMARARKAKMKKELGLLKQKVTTQEQQQSINTLEKQLDNNLTNKNRQQLLKEFVLLKKELEKTGRNLSFLSIDIVDSTGMKKGEDPVIVERDFNEYHDFIVNKFKEAGYIKAAWTPDGVMACFNTTEQAINAARSIIFGLKDFNQNTKMIKRDFNVRCGINTGFVYYDLSTPLEEFGDRVIDIAGHMQKHAKPNTIYIAQEIIKPIKTYDVFESNKVTVDGFAVCEWTPNIASKPIDADRPSIP